LDFQAPKLSSCWGKVDYCKKLTAGSVILKAKRGKNYRHMGHRDFDIMHLLQILTKKDRKILQLLH